MKQRPFVLFLFACIVLTTLFSNCASLTGFQTGKTVGEGNGELMLSLNASQSPKFNIDEIDTLDFLNIKYFPNLEFGGRYGIVEKLDIGIKFNTLLNIAIDGKYQLAGDQESLAAVSVGFGVGNFSGILPLWNIQIPLYLSIHPSDNFALYATPRVTRQFASGIVGASINYLGGNAGMLFGDKVKFGIDAGFYSLKKQGVKADIYTFGIGVKIPLEGDAGEDRRGR